MFLYISVRIPRSFIGLSIRFAVGFLLWVPSFVDSSDEPRCLNNMLGMEHVSSVGEEACLIGGSYSYTEIVISGTRSQDMFLILHNRIEEW